MSFTPVREVRVGLDFGGGTLAVGRLAIRQGRIYFEYDAGFIARGLPISPQRLPLQPGVRSFDPALFEGLPGVFNDSLPDGWGRLLLDRALRKEGLAPQQLSPLDRLVHVGRTGMGALVYEPEIEAQGAQAAIDLDVLAAQALDVLEGEADEVLEQLLALNGSSAGARPKAMIGYAPDKDAIVHGALALPSGFEHWLVKFANSQDGADAGAIEYVYALMAKAAGVEMTDTHLFPARRGAGYFATRRYDRERETRLHAHTASGLLHSDFRVPALDYQDLLALSSLLTRDIRETEKMFRLAVFNVLAHNRDDHAKNFTFLMDDKGEWRVSPAYDLTFSTGPRGEQSMMVMGEGKNPGEEHLQKLGADAGLAKARVHDIIEATRAALSEWRSLAKAHGVSAAAIRLIAGRIAA